jgi:hypothetical protein
MLTLEEREKRNMGQCVRDLPLPFSGLNMDVLGFSEMYATSSVTYVVITPKTRH